MNKKALIHRIRRMYPNIKWIRKTLSALRVRRICRFSLDEKSVMIGENSFEQKRIITKRCIKKWGPEIKSTIKKADEILQNPVCYGNRKNKERLRIDMLFCYFAYGFQPEEYLCFELEGKSMEVRKSFVSDTDRMRYVFSMNDISDIQIFNDKSMTYPLFSPYYQRDIVSIDKQSDYAKFEDFVKKHPTFVKKDVFESLGRSVELVDINSVAASKRDYFNSLISKGKVILEEQVVQSEDFSALNESSVNTVRCITFNTRHGVVAPYYFMKIGRVGSFVDNAGAGGIIIGIDKDTGKLVTDGYDELNRRFETHPDSGIVLKGIQLPDWDQLNAICKEMSAKMQNVKFIGWDLAHTDQGWVVIEGNGMSQLICPQIVFKRGIKKEVEDLMKDVDLIV